MYMNFQYKHIYLFLFLCCISSIKNAAMLLHLPHTFMYEHFPKTNENERAVAREIHTRKILKIQFLILILLQRIISGLNSTQQAKQRRRGVGPQVKQQQQWKIPKSLEDSQYEDKYEKMTASLSYLTPSVCAGWMRTRGCFARRDDKENFIWFQFEKFSINKLIVFSSCCFRNASIQGKSKFYRILAGCTAEGWGCGMYILITLKCAAVIPFPFLRFGWNAGRRDEWHDIANKMELNCEIMKIRITISTTYKLSTFWINNEIYNSINVAGSGMRRRIEGIHFMLMTGGMYSRRWRWRVNFYLYLFFMHICFEGFPHCHLIALYVCLQPVCDLYFMSCLSI